MVAKPPVDPSHLHQQRLATARMICRAKIFYPKRCTIHLDSNLNSRLTVSTF
eukprot:m.80495 g.80495  ORF g.80495 m.80495 type:complete len:52 (-) comp16294_c0_seq1:70-225(-)